MKKDKKSFKKVLVIGLGGIGGTIIEKVARENKSDNVAFIALDTDSSCLEILEETPNINTIYLNSEHSVKDNLRMFPETYKWFPVDNYYEHDLDNDSPFETRIESRLILQDQDLLKKIYQVFEKVLTNFIDIDIERGFVIEPKIKVIIVSSLAGGTGSGLLLPVTQILKSILWEKNLFYTVRGLFIMPSVLSDFIADPILFERKEANAYATLKEINAQNLISKADPYKLSDFEMHLEGFDSDNDLGHAEKLPFNHIYLIDKYRNYSPPIKFLEDIVIEAKEILKTQIYQPSGFNLFSLEDDQFYDFGLNDGQNIYSSAAATKFVYPYEDILDYLTTRNAIKVIKEKWGSFGQAYEMVLHTYLMNRRYDPNVEEPQFQSVVINEVENILNKGGEPQFTFLREDLLINGIDENRVVKHYEKIKKFIKSQVAKDKDLSIYRNKCEIDDKGVMALKKRDTAINHIKYIRSNLVAYQNYIESLTERELVYSIAHSIWPMNFDLYRDEETETFNDFLKKDPYAEGNVRLLNLFKVQGKIVDPMSALYILSKSIQLIESDLKYLDLDFVKLKKQIEFFDVAFDDPETDYLIEEPEDRAEQLLNQPFGILRRPYREFRDAFIKLVQNQLSLLDSYKELIVLRKVLRTVRRNLQEIEEVYIEFFNLFARTLDYLEKEEEFLRTKHVNDFFTIYLKSNDAEKEHIYQEFSRNYIPSTHLNEGFKEKVNYKLFLEVIKRFDDSPEYLLFVKRFKEREIEDIFRDYFIQESKEDIRKEASSLIDKDIFTILIEQATDKTTGAINNNLIIKLFEDLNDRAEPLIERNYESTPFGTSSPVRKISYLGINPVITQEIRNNWNLIKSVKEGKPGIKAHSILTASSESYSPYELQWYNALYGLNLQNIFSLKELKVSYQEVIKWLDTKKEDQSMDANERKFDAITPHLDIRWHETLPEILEEDNNL